MGRKTARKTIGNKYNPAGIYPKLKRGINDSNKPWHYKVKRNNSHNIKAENLDDSR